MERNDTWYHAEYFKVENDIVFEIGLTPNRSDAMGHFGVARDLKTVLNYNGSNLELCLPDIKEFKKDRGSLIIKKMASDGTTVGKIKHYIRKLITRGMRPDIILLD